MSLGDRDASRAHARIDASFSTRREPMDYDRLRELQEKYEENPRRYFAPLANEYRKGGQVKRAIEICRSQLAQMPGHMSGQIVFGQSLYEAGEFDEARKVFERALALDPENLIALKSLGDMSLQAGNASEARSWYARLLDADPKDAAAIALVSEIDASSDAAPVAMATEILGGDTDAGDQQIPAAIEEVPELQPATEESSTVAAESEAPSDAPNAPVGLERHYPVEESPSEEAAAQASSAQGLGTEDLGVPAGASAAEGLTSVIPESGNPLDWGPPSSAAPAQEVAAPPPEPPVTASASHSEPSATAPERPAQSEEKTFTGASAEPFVNETMAQLYLQQGYKQLALQVYRQLAESRPQDEGLRQRIADVEAADAAEHPDEAPSTRQPSPERESIQAPAWDEPRAESEGIGARQPSIKEFFATLGRRRPARSRSGNNQPADTRAPLATAAPGASLDAVFAGATVSPSDARAASRLAGAFSGAAGASRTPSTPPVPTPRVNPRVPHSPESEEDVAKFRAWLDGLTGE
jgi:tetratricopeptide (TPR) repeat protein